MSIKEVCKVKLDISQKKTQLPSLFRPVNPLTPVELKEAIVTIFDFILAHDKFRRKSKLRKNRWKKTYRSESSTRDSGKQRKEPLINDYFDSPMIARILGHVCYIFKNEPTLLNINFPLNPMAKNRNDPTTTPTTSHELIVCGDIHGSISELMAIFEQHGMPPVTNFLFLGDYVDRGKCSLSVILFLFLMKIRWPKHLYMLRGNHEAFVISSEYGFRKECKKHFPDESIFGLLNVVFAYMPLAAIIHSNFLF